MKSKILWVLCGLCLCIATFGDPGPGVGPDKHVFAFSVLSVIFLASGFWFQKYENIARREEQILELEHQAKVAEYKRKMRPTNQGTSSKKEGVRFLRGRCSHCGSTDIEIKETGR